MSLRMVGPPYVPWFPIPIGDSKHIYVFVESKYDSLHFASDAPEFSLRSKYGLTPSEKLLNGKRIDIPLILEEIHRILSK